MRDMVQVRGGAPNRYQAPQARYGRSQFDLSHNHKTTFDAGQLIPYLVQEVIPGDTFTCKLNAFVRIFSPLDAPIMDNISVGIDYFFVPNRLLWSNWEAFLGAHDAKGAQDTDYTVPILADGYTVVSSDLLNYMGLPIGVQTAPTEVVALPVRAYGLIYNEWYRDQNLIDEVTVDLTDGPGALGSGYSLLKSAKRPDYFTTALPYLQKGDAQAVALTGILEVYHEGSSADPVAVYNTGSSQYRDLNSSGADLALDSTQAVVSEVLRVNLAGGTGAATAFGKVDINALREAAAIQRLLERDARGGTRHPELIRAHFGVDVPDYRTQRPEYLGGSNGWVNVSPVANTSGTATEDQGQLAGVGAGRLTSSWAKSFVEHGWILGLMRARGEVSYQQGVDRKWSRSTKLDYLWPELTNLGEQPIYNRELFIANTSADDDVFGYQERYAEYRFSKSLITGKFASDASGSLDFWHLSEDFSGTPTLNQTFIEDQTPMSRVTTVDDEPDFIIDGRFDLRVARVLPVRPTPSLAPARF